MVDSQLTYALDDTDLSNSPRHRSHPFSFTAP